MSERLSRSARPAVPDLSGTIVNAMTVDVEDYFHVSAFDRIVSRARWDGFESRVADNTDRLLELLARCTSMKLR